MPSVEALLSWALFLVGIPFGFPLIVAGLVAHLSRRALAPALAGVVLGGVAVVCWSSVNVSEPVLSWVAEKMAYGWGLCAVLLLAVSGWRWYATRAEAPPRRGHALRGGRH